jgi:hypothetical protein
VAKKPAAKTPAKAAKPVKGAKMAPSAKSASTGNKRMTKSAIFAELSEKTSLSKKQVGDFFEHLFELIKREVSKGGPGEFVLPTSIIKVKRITKKETPERTRPDPRDPTVMRTYPRKPEHLAIKVYALKTLKDLYPKP